MHPACHAGGLLGALQAVLRLHGHQEEALGLEEVDVDLLGARGFVNGIAYWATEFGMRQALYQPGEKPPKPWGHLSAEWVAKLLAGVRQLPRLRAEAGVDAGPCLLGSCCWCGQYLSRFWHDEGHQWPDGTPAPLCDACFEVFDRRRSYCPDPRDWDDQRAAISEALTGVPLDMGEQAPKTLRAFAEVITEGHVGEGEPWAHLRTDVVLRYRLDQWARHDGRYAPADQRAFVLKRARLKAEQEAQRRAEAQQAREAKALAAIPYQSSQRQSAQQQ
jgi:hypothetical protein